MTKLEEKLLQLGYKKKDSCCYEKDFIDGYIFICIEMFPPFMNAEGIIEAYVYDSFRFISTQEHLTNLQQAFNILQSDLEVVKEYE